jgi:hypothetical protein
MCMSCGCGRPDDQMNDERNITREGLQAAADAAGISLEQAAQNILETTQKVAAA